MHSQGAFLAEHDGTSRGPGTARMPCFNARLALGYYVNFTGAWRTGVTRTVSRNAVEFVPSDRTLSVGDSLQFVIVFPGFEGRVGAVVLCRGRVVRADATVVVTVDQQHLQRAARDDARRSWLRDLCEAARLGGSPAAAPATNAGLPARSAVLPGKHGREAAPDRRLSVASPA